MAKKRSTFRKILAIAGLAFGLYRLYTDLRRKEPWNQARIVAVVASSVLLLDRALDLLRPEREKTAVWRVVRIAATAANFIAARRAKV